MNMFVKSSLYLHFTCQRGRNLMGARKDECLPNIFLPKISFFLLNCRMANKKNWGDSGEGVYVY